MGNQQTTQQLESVLTSVETSAQLKSLHLSYNKLSSVKPSLLLSLVSQLEELSLMYCEMNTDHIENILGAMNRDSSSLKSLELSYNNLSAVMPELMAAKVNLLETAGLVRTGLTREQVSTLLSASLEHTALTCLRIGGLNCVADMELVTEARSKYFLE